MIKQLRVGDKLHCSNGHTYSIIDGDGFNYPLAIIDERENFIDYIFRGHEIIYRYPFKLYVGDPVINTMILRIT